MSVTPNWITLAKKLKRKMERNPQGIEQENAATDDVCPICFENFTVPCRANCGHWFCAACILQWWSYVSVIQPCKCPLCSHPIINLVPDMSRPVQPGMNVAVVIRKVDHYNQLFDGGLYAFFLKALMLPFFIKKAFRVLTNLETVTCILCIIRCLGLLLMLFYGLREFVSIGRLKINKVIDIGANVVLAGLFAYHMWQRWELRVLQRRLAEIQRWNDVVDLHTAYANLQAHLD